ncbi:MAG: aminotransferase, partial [Acholeplasmataceae bacterium]|nr:aminotransferase [Acholeplasmataceae bacterium]
GDAFFPNGKTDRNMRINYSNMPDEKIVEGIRRMAEAIKESM